jgi:hypothetical protein
MGFLCGTFRQLLAILTVMLSRPDIGRFFVWDKYVGVLTEKVRSDCIPKEDV